MALDEVIAATPGVDRSRPPSLRLLFSRFEKEIATGSALDGICEAVEQARRSGSTVVDHYALLGMDPIRPCTTRDVQNAVRARLKAVHPDLQPDGLKAVCNLLAAALNAARSVLSDPQTKETYDRELSNRTPNVHVRVKLRRCPYCHDELQPGETWHTCNACRTAHHDECWRVHPGCAVHGCSGEPRATATGPGQTNGQHWRWGYRVEPGLTFMVVVSLDEARREAEAGSRGCRRSFVARSGDPTWEVVEEYFNGDLVVARMDLPPRGRPDQRTSPAYAGCPDCRLPRSGTACVDWWSTWRKGTA